MTPVWLVVPASTSTVRVPVPRSLDPKTNLFDSRRVALPLPKEVLSDTGPPKLFRASSRVMSFPGPTPVTVKLAVPLLEIPPAFCVIGPTALKLMLRSEAKPFRVGASKSVTPV